MDRPSKAEEKSHIQCLACGIETWTKVELLEGDVSIQQVVEEHFCCLEVTCTGKQKVVAE